MTAQDELSAMQKLQTYLSQQNIVLEYDAQHLIDFSKLNMTLKYNEVWIS